MELAIKNYKMWLNKIKEHEILEDLVSIKGDFQEIHIMNSSSKIATPCFICRQVLIEFCSPDMPVYLYTKDKEEKHLLEEFTPLVFNEDNL